MKSLTFVYFFLFNKLKFKETGSKDTRKSQEVNSVT